MFQRKVLEGMDSISNWFENANDGRGKVWIRINVFHFYSKHLQQLWYRIEGEKLKIKRNLFKRQGACVKIVVFVLKHGKQNQPTV